MRTEKQCANIFSMMEEVCPINMIKEQNKIKMVKGMKKKAM
jgi:hypothetical protein